MSMKLSVASPKWSKVFNLFSRNDGVNCANKVIYRTVNVSRTSSHNGKTGCWARKGSILTLKFLTVMVTLALYLPWPNRTACEVSIGTGSKNTYHVTYLNEYLTTGSYKILQRYLSSALRGSGVLWTGYTSSIGGPGPSKLSKLKHKETALRSNRTQHKNTYSVTNLSTHIMLGHCDVLELSMPPITSELPNRAQHVNTYCVTHLNTHKMLGPCEVLELYTLSINFELYVFLFSSLNVHLKLF